MIFQDADRRNVSDASTLHYGIDLGLRWQISDALDLALDGTLARHEYDSNIALLGSSGNINGNQIDTAPEHFGSLRFGWNFLPGFRAELEWAHMGDYFLEPDNQHEVRRPRPAQPAGHRCSGTGWTWACGRPT